MKVDWKKILGTNRSNHLYAGIVSICVAIAIPCIKLSWPIVREKSHLFFIEDTFKDYKWTRAGRGSLLTFRLQNYRDNFQIAADFYSILKRKEFKNISYGDTIIISIPKAHKEYLNTGKRRLRVFSVEGRHDVYLSYNRSIKRYNSPLLIIGAAFFLLLGIGLLYYRSKMRSPLK